MPTVTIKLLQTPAILFDEKPVLLPFKKAEALLFALAMKQSLSREQAAALLWDQDDAQVAKKNLRHTLYVIKKEFGEELIVSPKKQMLTLNPALDFDVDYHRFIETGDVFLYQNELLSGFEVKNAAAFDEWLEQERAVLRGQYLRLLYDKLCALPPSDVSAHDELFARYVREDPFDERAYLMMMRCCEHNGLYHKGIKVYESVSRLLNSELRISPCKELVELHRALLSRWTAASEAEPQQEQAKIIGREPQLAQLQKWYHAFLLGQCGAVCVQGDNGVGKTFFVNHFLDGLEPDGCIMLKAICFQAEREFALQPWNAVMLQLDSYIRAHGVRLPEHYTECIGALFPLFGSPVAGAGMPEDVAAGYSYRAVRNGIIQLLSRLGQENPIVLFFDNIHNMDPQSLELLSLVIRERNPNIFCIFTALDMLAPPVQRVLNALQREKFVSLLQLHPFTEQDVAEILEQRLGDHALSPQVLRHIYQDSEGNGFFLDMLAGYLSAEADGESKRLAFTSPQEILLERVEGVSADARRLLDTISTCPGYASLALIEYIFNSNTLEIIEYIDELKQHGLVRERVVQEDIRFQFRHGKMQEFVHSLLSPAKRRLLHSRVAAYYEQARMPHDNSWLQTLLYHYGQAQNNAKVLQYKIMSLTELSRSSYELYPILTQQSGAPQPPRQITRYFDELLDELHRLYHEHPDEVDFEDLQAQLFLAMGKYYIAQGQYKKGMEALQKGLEQRRYLERRPAMHIAFLRQMTFYGIQVWNTDVMRENIQKSMGIASAHQYQIDYAIECRLYGLYLLMCGSYDESREYLNKAIALFQSVTLGQESYSLNLAACYNYLGESKRRQLQFEQALPLYYRAISICTDMGLAGNPTFYANRARALLALGRLQEATESLEAADALYNDTTILVGRAINKAYLSLLRAGQGQFEQALALLEESQMTLGSPLTDGILAQVKAELVERYPQVFAALIDQPPAALRAFARRTLAALPGTYEARGLPPALMRI